MNDSDKVEATIYVEGAVQGVGYRFFAEDWAQKLGLKGYCQNLLDGRVLVEVEGYRAVVEVLIEQLRKGPGRSRVTDLKIDWKPYRGRFSEFSIRHS